MTPSREKDDDRNKEVIVMKIVHIGLASYYTDGMAYQDNQLVEQNVRDGHEVVYISNAQKYASGEIVDVGYEDTVLPCGARLIRLPYVKIINGFVAEKVRKVRGLYQLLCELKPDVILSHDLCYWSVLDVIRYKKEHSELKLYADTHTNYGNSGRNWLSLHVLHRVYYRWLANKAMPYIETYFYTNSNGKRFSIDNYGLPENVMEFYPLGGNVPDRADYNVVRQSKREQLNLKLDELLLIHSGKLDEAKRTEELLKAFEAVPQLKAKLIIIGSMPDNMKDKLLPLIAADDRVEYHGWKNADELIKYLYAADLYLQPGSDSATMQNAVCSGCPVMLYPHSWYVEGFDYGNVIWTKTQNDIQTSFEKLAEQKIDLKMLSENSWRCANELLDYRKLAARLYV